MSASNNLGARRLTIIVTLLAGIVLIAFGIQRLIS